MPKTSAANKTRLLNPWALLVVAGAVGGLLWFNFQDEKVFAPGSQEPDQVSLNYAQLLLAAHPSDDELRLRLVDQLVQLGEFAAARQHIDQWPDPAPIVQAYYGAQIDALTLPQGADSSAVLSRFDALDLSQLTVQQLRSLATTQLRLQAPARAAKTFAYLADHDMANRQQWLHEQAQWAIAGGDPAQAARVYVALEQSAPADQQPAYLEQAFNQYVAADQGKPAVALLIERLPRLGKDDSALLEQGFNMAIAQRQPAQAQRLFDHWRTLQPDSPALMAKEFELRLSFNDLPGAWAVGQQLAALHPEDAEVLRKVAQVGQWQGDKHGALDLWLKALRLDPTPQAREQAWQLALALEDYAQAVPLLTQISASRALSDTELDALVYAHESAGTQVEGQVWLDTYTGQYPQHRRAWLVRIASLENSRHYGSAAQAWGQMAEHLPLTPLERVQWANTYLHSDNAANAWKVLDIDTAGITERSFWRVRAAIAWTQDDSEHLREALERLLALDGRLEQGDYSALIGYYRERDPARALSLALDSWHQAPDEQSLALALQLALDQNNWVQLQTLLAQAGHTEGLKPQVLQVIARGALASHEGDAVAAALAYEQGLQQFPDSNLLRERLLWLYLDQGQLDRLKPLVTQWRDLAREDKLLQLPMASAHLALGNTRQALAWYRLYLRAQPGDWLVQAAYADALDSAGYQDSALRLRHRLLRGQGHERPAPERLPTWVRLIANTRSPAQAQRQAWIWQDGSPAMLQVWFDQLLASLDNPTQRADWVNRARSQGIRLDANEDLRQALQSQARAQLEPLLERRNLSAGQRAEILNRLGRPGEARQVSVAAVGSASSEQANADLRAQALQLQAARPQGGQAAWNSQDYGGLSFDSQRLQVAGDLGKEWYADLKYEQGRYDSDDLIDSVLGTERNLKLTLEHAVQNGAYGLSLDTSQRDDENRNGVGINRSWQVTPRDYLQVGLDWHREADESGLMRTFGQRDQLYALGRHALTPRDQLSWRLAQKRFSTRQGDNMGSGQAINVALSHTLEFASPNWSVRGGADYQRNQLSNRALDGIGSNQGGALDLSAFSTDPSGQVMADDLLEARYGQLYVGSTWRRGTPGALNRSTPQYSWLIDTLAGWQWEDQTFNYGVTGGIGFGLFGNDELAIKLGYQSAPQGSDGKAGGVLNIGYSMPFGH